MPNAFSVTRRQEGDVTVLTLDGFLDAHTAPRFEHEIETAIREGRVKLVIACDGLSYVSSAGLGVFMAFIDEIRGKGGDIKICGLVPRVRQVLDILGFPSVYDILADVPAAVALFGARGARRKA